VSADRDTLIGYRLQRAREALVQQEASDALTQARGFVRWAEQWLREQGFLKEDAQTP
jgi:hypothetical protein